MPLLFVKRPFTVTPAFDYPLDEFPGATAGFSVRPLLAAYSDPIVEVRSNAGGTQDIYRDGTDLDTADLTSFLAGNLGLVRNMYNQADITDGLLQTTLAAQPQIANSSGVIHTEIGGKPTLHFDGTDDFFPSINNIQDYITVSNGTVLTVWQAVTIGTASGSTWLNDAVWEGNAFVGLHLHSTTPDCRAYNFDTTDDRTIQTIALTTSYVHIWRHTGGVLSSFLNSSTPTTVSSGNTGSLALEMVVAYNLSGAYSHMYFCELLAWDSGLSDGDCASLGSMVADYYGVTWT